ncbi:transposase family protein [Acinetobacter baumannii]|uniref:transposase family protein n=1 Tax=Acinetobacter baumannii TaxID=470 RepID=UPI0020CDE1BB|nr:transposase family protein [Acinetobacter baumannii]MCQ1048569.1 transposase family protein [Acinetobacter baumannii]
MSVELWEQGVIIEFNKGIPCHRAMVRSVGKAEVVLVDIENGAVSRLSREELGTVYASGGIKFLAESRDFGDLKFIDLSEAEQRETNRKYKYIKRLKENGISKITEKSARNTIEEVALELGEKAPHWQSVRSWYASFVEAGLKIQGLYPKHRFKGHRNPKIDAKVVEIIEYCAKRYYTLSQSSMASVVRNVEAKIMSHNLDHPDEPLQKPTYHTVQNRVLSGLYQTKRKGRYGARVLQAELAKALSGITTTRVLERVELDHTELDIHVLHDDYKTLLGRPNITALIDHYSGMLLGFQISFEAPSYASVCLACLNAFLPKNDFMNELKLDGSWPAHGIPSTLVTDNANEFWGKKFIAVADEIGTVFQYCPIRKGNYKSRIERFFGIVNALVLDDLPGVVRKIGKSGDGYDARQEAALTFSEFKRYFLKWVTEEYHHTPLEDSDLTPYEIWASSEECFPVPVEDKMELTTILLATATRTLNKSGIEIFSMNYDSSLLKDLYRRDGPGEVIVKYNPFDIGYILVLDKINKVYLKVDCLKYSYASNLSEFEHNKIRAAARAARQSKFDNLNLQKAKIQLAKEREEYHARNVRRSKQVTTSKAARSDKTGVPNISLVVDNSHRTMKVDFEDDGDNLSLNGWSMG